MTFLVIGLGNPGPQYQKTPHNVGFLTLDRICEQNNFGLSLDKKFNAYFGMTTLNVDNKLTKVYFAKPLSFMNLSGGPVCFMMNYFKFDPQQLIVVHDDIDLNYSALKIKIGGSDAGHNGLKSITKAIKTNQYYRIRVGVGRDTYVTKSFNRQQMSSLDQILDYAANATMQLISSDMKAAQNLYQTNAIID